MPFAAEPRISAAHRARVALSLKRPADGLAPVYPGERKPEVDGAAEGRLDIVTADPAFAHLRGLQRIW